MGNNVVNFWKGNEIKHPKNPGGSFQSFFTGSNGNIHYGWIGRLATTDGTMLHSTFVGEYSEGAKVGKKSWDDPNLDGWPRFDSAWPDINTTDCNCRPGQQVPAISISLVLVVGNHHGQCLAEECQTQRWQKVPGKILSVVIPLI